MKETRPWGFYRTIEETEEYKVKYIYVEAGKRLSLQKHEFRSESWVIISGNPMVTVDDQTFSMRPRESISIGMGQLHRIEAPEDSPVEFVEVQTGKYFGEDDIVRVEDDFGRA
jgi:mannose-6-phosphate isomerase-like protein (cupin superfamily)